MKTFINNTNIAYSDHGIGLPVIFLHAFPLNRSMWEGEMIALLQEQAYRLVSLDWRGFGESDIPNAILPQILFASDVAALMGLLGIEKTILSGLSNRGV